MERGAGQGVDEGSVEHLFLRFSGVLIYGSGGDRALNGVLEAMLAGHLRETTAHCTPIGRVEPSGRCTPGMHRPRRETGGPAALPGNRPGEPQRRRGRADHSGNVTDMATRRHGETRPMRRPQRTGRPHPPPPPLSAIRPSGQCHDAREGVKNGARDDDQGASHTKRHRKRKRGGRAVKTLLRGTRGEPPG